MTSFLRHASLALCAGLLLASFGQQADAALVRQQRVASGLTRPMFTTFAPGDPTRLFFAVQSTPASSSNSTATIRILNLTTGVLEPTPFLSIPELDNRNEGGLLGLAFHPDFQNNGKFYVNVTSSKDAPFTTYIREYAAPSATSNTANPSFTKILEFTQPQMNHNGGWIGFGPKDDYLYIMAGDGGNGNDQGTGHIEPGGNAQNLTTLLGKALRIDVDRDDFTTDANRNYGIPTDNPFVSNPNARPEIWAYGLRNPFRAGFDRATGDLWMGDVGQDRLEEIDFQPGNSVGGENYGWRIREGTIATPGVGGPKPAGVIDPIYDYPHTGGNADFNGAIVMGGVPYRGPDPTLQGAYFFADQGNSKLWMLRPATETTPQQVVRLNTATNPILPKDVGSASNPVSITEDINGNLYITYYGSGEVYRIVTNALTPGDFNADAKVDAADLAAWKTGFGQSRGALAKDGDADGDGDVDGNDFLAWQRNYGWSALNVGAIATSNAIPEPTSVVLFVAAAMMLGGVRRKR